MATTTKTSTRNVKPAPAVTTATVALSPVETIAELIERREHLLELKDLTDQAPRSFEEAAADLPRVIELLASRCEPQLAWVAQSPSGYADLARQLGQPDNDYQQIPAASLLSWCIPDALAAALKRGLQASYAEMPKPMSSAAKAAELSRLQSEIGAVEVAIASAWWQAVDAGMALDVPPVSGAVLVGLSD